MIDKKFDKNQVILGSSLRKTSALQLKNLVEANKKLGIKIEGELSVVMLPWNQFEQVVDLIDEKEAEILRLAKIAEELSLKKP